MKKLLIAALIAACSLFACKKDSSPACEINNTGTLSVASTSSNPYSISIDGVNQGNIGGLAGQTYTESVGAHTVVATQVSGYVLYPTTKTSNVSVTQCTNTAFSFP